MTKTFVNPDNVAPPVAQYSHAVRIDLGSAILIQTAGQVAMDEHGNLVGKGEMRAQAMQTLENIKRILEANGAAISDITKVNWYVTDMRWRDELGAARDHYFGSHAPCSTLVEVSGLASPDWLIEIEVTAVIMK